jgi:alpha-2-macroglobulin
VGTYRVRLYQPGKTEYAGGFEVQAYQLQKVDLVFDLPKTVYYRGEKIEADLVAKYQYGTPLVGHLINVQLPDGRTLTGETDAAGKYHVTFETEGFAEEQALRLVAQLPQDGIAAAANVMLAIRAFRIDLRTSRDVYLDGETFRLDVTTLDAQGEPTGQTLTASVLKQVEQAGRVTEREASKATLTTDAKTGKGSVSLKVEDDEGGRYVVRVSGTDRFQNPVVADRALTISGQKDETRLRLLADRQTFKVGESATIHLHSRSSSSTALLAWEADRILTYKLVALQEGDNSITWSVDGAQFPNFTLTAAQMVGTKFHQAQLDIRVERDLRVTVKPIKSAVGPGEEVEVEVTTVDQLGRPVSAELSLVLVDRALLRLFNDRLPPITAFFYNQTRTGAFTTEATNTFRYEPQTEGVADAVVEDAERQAAKLDDLAGADRTRRRAGAEADAAKSLGRADRKEGTSYFFSDAVPPALPSAAGMGGGGHLNEFGGAPSAPNALGVELNMPDSSATGELRRNRAFSVVEQSGTRAGRPAVQPRQQFVETAYWNPSVVTDRDGKARVTFRAPMALSEYHFSSRGVTGAETLVGQATAELRVRKDFFVDLKLPSTLTQGDRPRFTAQVHHTGVKGQAEVKLTVYSGGREQVYPKALDIQADGVAELIFEPYEVPDSESVRLTLSARLGESTDDLVSEVPIRPWGVQAFASASGTASDDATVFVGLPAGRTYESPEMLVVVSPTMRRLLIELALGRDAYIFDRRYSACIFPGPPNTTADRASDLLAATSALSYLRTTRAADAPEASRLGDRIQGLVAELVTVQNEDGGWPWVVSGQGAKPSDRLSSASALWALASAEPLGLVTDAKVLDKAVTYLTQEFAKTSGSDFDTRAALLHALSTRNKAGFEAANSLNRDKRNLSSAALAYLALTFANLERTALGNEVLDVLLPKSKTEPTEPGKRPRRFWDAESRNPWHRGAAETTALAAFALARVRPEAAELSESVDWLLAHRLGTGWQPAKAKGPALAALAGFYGKAQNAEDRYRLVVLVNDTEVYRTEVMGAAEGKAVLVPRRALKLGDRNRVRFDIEGRGTFGYAVTLTGFSRDFKPDQNQTGRAFLVYNRTYGPAAPELDGKTLPVGFDVSVNATYFENHVTQVALGGRARVTLHASRSTPAGQPAWERDFLILEEYLPAGTTLIDGSVQTSASSYSLADGVLTFYFTPDQFPSAQYEVFGYLPGQYRALPARLRSAYDPGRSHLGPVGDLRVLSPGEKPTDPYKATPAELYSRGKILFDSGRLAQALAPLEELFSGYTLRDDVAKDAARMLLYINIQEYQPRKVVQYFEVLKEKAPELVIPFDKILVVGKAYRDINEHERAYLVWRAIHEASYLEDARVGEVLRQRGKTLEGLAFLLDLWREYPDSASIESDFFGLSQLLASLAGKATTDPSLRKELAEAEVTRSDLLLQAIRLVQIFFSLAPKNPLADEASLALINDFLELEDFETVVKLSERFAQLYPKSTFLDSFQYSEALGRFHLGQNDRAIEVAEAIAKATYKDANGVEQPSPNKWQAIYILGQIYDARRRPAQALSYYKQVAERFTDAAGAVKALTREDLTLPEVTVVNPADAPAVAADDGKGLRAVPAQQPKNQPGKPTVALGYRNIAEVDVKVYPVDLMRLYLTERNLDQIANIDLAGITPLHETTIKLGSGEDFADKKNSISLPLEKEGAYLVMIRGHNLYASGIVLVTPLELEVLEESDSGRVRVTVRDAHTKDFVPKVQVKVIGSDNQAFLSGETDLRGVFVAEGVRGQVAAVARKGTSQYAFYRGTSYVGAPPAPNAGEPRKGAQAGENGQVPSQALDENLRIQNGSNQMRQIERLQQRYSMPAEAAPAGVQVQGVK